MEEQAEEDGLEEKGVEWTSRGKGMRSHVALKRKIDVAHVLLSGEREGVVLVSG